MQKNLAILFCSFRPAQYTEQVRDGREKEYRICLSRALDVIPLDRFDVVVVDNTVGDLDGVRLQELRELLLNDTRITDVFFLSENIGEKNKGQGELLMLNSVLENIEPGKYKNISYITARRIFANPYVFEKTDSMTKEALLSNPDFYYLDGKVAKTESGLFNDMFFSMSDSLMRRYATFSMANIPYNIRNNLGSEQNLFRFVVENNIEYEWLKWLGVIRNDWMLDQKQDSFANVHIC